MSDAPRQRPLEDRQAIFALNELIAATRDLADALMAATRNLHADLAVSVPERAILIELRKAGDLTVPALARRRGVSRQFSQTVVNGLCRRNLVAAHDNPAHRRSKLVALTPAGRDLLREVLRHEGAVLQDLALGLSAGEVRQAAAALGRVRRNLSQRDLAG